MQRILIGFLLLYLISACAFDGRYGESHVVKIGDEYRVKYLDNGVFKVAVIVQKVDVTIGNRHQSLILQTEADGNRVAMVGLSPVGNKIFYAELLEGHFSYYIEPLATVLISPAEFMWIFQIVFWPMDSVQQALREQGFAVHEKIEAGMLCRHIFFSEKLLISVRYDQLDSFSSQLFYEDKLAEYSLKMSTLEYAR